eukprot:COSAG02_NODE_1026_length_15134_cov_382.979714_17_plen_88_part_00
MRTTVRRARRHSLCVCVEVWLQQRATDGRRSARTNPVRRPDGSVRARGACATRGRARELRQLASSQSSSAWGLMNFTPTRPSLSLCG